MYLQNPMEPPDLTGEASQPIEPLKLPDRSSKKSAYQSFRTRFSGSSNYRQLENEKLAAAKQLTSGSPRQGSKQSKNSRRPHSDGALAHHQHNEKQGENLLIDLSDTSQSFPNPMTSNHSSSQSDALSLLESSISDKYGYLPPPISEQSKSTSDPFEIKQSQSSPSDPFEVKPSTALGSSLLLPATSSHNSSSSDSFESYPEYSQQAAAPPESSLSYSAGAEFLGVQQVTRSSASSSNPPIPPRIYANVSQTGAPSEIGLTRKSVSSSELHHFPPQRPSSRHRNVRAAGMGLSSPIRDVNSGMFLLLSF